MSSGIVLSAGVRQNLLSLQNTAALTAITQNRLATGKKVNSALDNPSSFFTSQALQDRAGDLGTLLDQIGQAVQTLQAANQGITQLTSLVQSAKSLANQALQSTKGVSSASATGTVALTDPLVAGLKSGDVLTLKNGSAQATVTFGTATGQVSTVQGLIDAINSQTTTSGITASKDASNHLVLSTPTAASIAVTDTNTTAGTDVTALGLTATTATTAAFAPEATRASLQTQYNAILSQIDQLAGDASFNGINLLNGDNLKVAFNEKNTSSLTISGVTFNSAGLGLSPITGGTTATTGFQDNNTINTTITALNSALTTLRTEAGTLGSNLTVVQIRQNFTTNLINTLQTGADNLVLADTNQEGANMLALQTRQQLSTTALSLANQANQSVLRLFG